MSTAVQNFITTRITQLQKVLDAIGAGHAVQVETFNPSHEGDESRIFDMPLSVALCDTVALAALTNALTIEITVLRSAQSFLEDSCQIN